MISKIRSSTDSRENQQGKILSDQSSYCLLLDNIELLNSPLQSLGTRMQAEKLAGGTPTTYLKGAYKRRDPKILGEKKMNLNPRGKQFLAKYLRRFGIKSKLSLFLVLFGGSFILKNVLLVVAIALADTGYHLAAREATLGGTRANTTSSVLSPAPGSTIQFSFKNQSVGNIAVYASFSSDTGGGSEAKTGTWDIELYDATSGTTVADSQDVERYLSGITDQGMIGVCSVFTGLEQNVTYEVRLRHATSGGTLRTKNVNMVMLPLFSDKAMSLNYAQHTSTTGVTTTSPSYVDTDLIGSISLDPGITGAYILITAAINAESTGLGSVRIGTWKLLAGQRGSYNDYGVPVERYLSGANDIGSVVLHVLAGPFDASDGKISFKVQHKSSKAGIRTLNGTLMAIALSDYDSDTRTQYNYVSGQNNSTGNIKTTSTSLTAVYNARTGDRVRVSPNLTSEARVFLGANFNNSTPIPATVTFDIGKGSSSQAQKVKRVTGKNGMGAGCLFSISDILKAGTHDSDLRHATTSMLNTSGANLVYVILGYDVHPPG